jgi:hypothetical protein
MAPASAENRELAIMVAKAFGGATPVVRRYWDEGESHHVDIAHVDDSPWTGVTSLGTLGLSDHPLMDNGSEYPARCELVGASNANYRFFPNIVATCAFNILKNKRFACPGRIFGNVVAMYYPDYQVRHVMFWDPFPWENHLMTVEFPRKTVAWLLVVPISESEMEYARSSPPGALEDLFRRYQVDMFDLERTSVI